MGKAYADELLPDRHALFMLMQGYVAVSDPEIRDHVRRKYGEVISDVSRAVRRAARRGLALLRHGMHLNIVTALDLGAIAEDEPRRRRLAWRPFKAS